MSKLDEENSHLNSKQNFPPKALLITFLPQSKRSYPTRTNSKIAILLFRVSFDIERDVSTNSSRGAEKRLQILSSPQLGEVKSTLNKCYEAFLPALMFHNEKFWS